MALPTLSGKGFLLSEGIELKFSKGGMAYAHLPLSFRNNRKTDNGWEHDKEIRVDATVFGALAEALSAEIDGRVELAVSGDAYLETWTDKDGLERTTVKMMVTTAWPTTKPAARTPATVGSRATKSEDSDLPF